MSAHSTQSSAVGNTIGRVPTVPLVQFFFPFKYTGITAISPVVKWRCGRSQLEYNDQEKCEWWASPSTMAHLLSCTLCNSTYILWDQSKARVSCRWIGRVLVKATQINIKGNYWHDEELKNIWTRRKINK